MSRNRRGWRHGGGRNESQPQRNTEPRRGPSELTQRYNIDAFELFCAYHLGITEEDTYRFQNVHHVAKRFKTNAGVIKQALVDLGMDPDTIVHSTFDMASAQVDVMLAPEGISRTEIARVLFEEFKTAPRRSRNWQKELEQDARDNERIFGRR
jgi:hypothetical protein